MPFKDSPEGHTISFEAILDEKMKKALDQRRDKLNAARGNSEKTRSILREILNDSEVSKAYADLEASRNTLNPNQHPIYKVKSQETVCGDLVRHKQTMKNPNKPIFILPLLLLACESPGIKNDTLNDRVKACSAGFAIETQGDLHASVNKENLEGGLSAGAKEETRSIIFSQIPEKDRHAVYTDYIRCIEKHWN